MTKETKEAMERLCELIEEAYPHETPTEDIGTVWKALEAGKKPTMTKETIEWVHNTAEELIKEQVKAYEDKVVRTDEEEGWLNRAQNWISYTEQHYKPE